MVFSHNSSFATKSDKMSCSPYSICGFLRAVSLPYVKTNWWNQGMCWSQPILLHTWHLLWLTLLLDSWKKSASLAFRSFLIVLWFLLLLLTSFVFCFSVVCFTFQWKWVGSLNGTYASVMQRIKRDDFLDFLIVLMCSRGRWLRLNGTESQLWM